MQLPGLVQGHLRKLHLIDIIFAMAGAHLKLTCAWDCSSAEDNLTESKTRLIAAYACLHFGTWQPWRLTCLELLKRGRRGLDDHTRFASGQAISPYSM